MKIAVIDDERPARSELKHQILEILPEVEISEADSGISALKLFEKESFDILFLDINLNDMEGTTLAAAVQRMMPAAKIIFATAYSDYAVKAFELGVDNYILKPFSPERLKNVLDRCISAMGSESLPASTPTRMPIHTSRKTIFLDISQIAYIETSGRCCTIHTFCGDFTENLLFGEYERKLAPCGFFRIHKSYLIQLDYVTELFPWASNSLALKIQGFENQILPVSREKVCQLKQLLHLS